MDSEFKANITRGSTWLCALFMVLFGVIYSIAEIVLVAVVVFQFLHTLVTGRTNQALLGFGGALSTFLYQVFSFLTYTSERKPFPFAPWPAGASPELEVVEPEAEPDAEPDAELSANRSE
jgi:hypothetical protein